MRKRMMLAVLFMAMATGGCALFSDPAMMVGSWWRSHDLVYSNGVKIEDTNYSEGTSPENLIVTDTDFFSISTVSSMTQEMQYSLDPGAGLITFENESMGQVLPYEFTSEGLLKIISTNYYSSYPLYAELYYTKKQ